MQQILRRSRDGARARRHFLFSPSFPLFLQSLLSRHFVQVEVECAARAQRASKRGESFAWVRL